MDENMINCPVCGGIAVFLGQLGRRLHFRCRGCGIGFSQLDES